MLVCGRLVGDKPRSVPFTGFHPHLNSVKDVQSGPSSFFLMTIFFSLLKDLNVSFHYEVL